MITEADYPNLSRFLGAYLHEDYEDFYGDVEGAVAALYAAGGPGRTSEVLNELVQLRARQLDDAGIAAALTAMGSYFWVPASGLPYADWLGWLENELRTVLADGNSTPA